MKRTLNLEVVLRKRENLQKLHLEDFQSRLQEEFKDSKIIKTEALMSRIRSLIKELFYFAGSTIFYISILKKDADIKFPVADKTLCIWLGVNTVNIAVTPTK